ncbi:MAG: HAMP domain-containing sensor histidine kinase, partial [Pseudomonadota bacterium]
VKEDVTARKKLEEQLRFARLAAEEANQSKSSFLANMSHELRTPLNAILGFSEAVKMGIPAPLTHPKHVEYIGLIHQSAGHLLQLINDILDLSKIESGAQTLQEARICLPDVLETCVRMVRERADRKNIRLDVDVGDDCPGLTADERMIKQIVLNLLTNAIKFTPNGGVVSIGVALDGGGLAVRVADSGVGIGPEDMRRVFTPFARAEGDPYVRGQEGTGLGLVLTRKMVDMHGGALTLDSVPGTGTTATVRFPASRLALLADSA